MLQVEPHPLLEAVAFTTAFPAPLGQIATPQAVLDLFVPGAAAPMSSSDEVRGAVRDLLRHGGFKPTGRSKPASEYLVRAVSEAALPSINLAVDACNAASLHTGLPVSVVDLDRARAPFRIDVAPPDTRYVFNAAGQEIDLGGLVMLFDADGPCAGPVKDSHRTKTHAGTTRTLSVVWATRARPELTDGAVRWYRALLDDAGARTEAVDTR